MKYVFSPDNKFKIWRKLWIALAESERDLGVGITQEQIDELKAHASDIDYEAVLAYERETKHDVVAHIKAYADQCVKAGGIIHLGATSCYVGDNTDIILMRQGLELIKRQLLAVIEALSVFARKYKGMPTLGFTHFQPAQLTTVGKRATLWIWELLSDFYKLDYIVCGIRFFGSKGATGTQASFLELFNGDYEKVKKLDDLISKRMGFASVYPVSGQTYSRKLDYDVLSALSGIAQSSHKFAGDIRLLQNLREMEEPFDKSQVGSSAMAYKRNPINCERICSLARYVIADALNPAMTAATQWFERTLDDSANKRISVPEAFLAIDAILKIYLDLAKGMVVYPKVIDKHIAEELPFMITENIIINAVKKGGDRQKLHEKMRVYAMEAAMAVKEGFSNDLIENIVKDADFDINSDEMDEMLRAENYTGCAQKQTEEFLDNYVLSLVECAI